MNFSICVPTRGRPGNVERLTNSIMNTASKPDEVEMIFRIDDDDELTIAEKLSEHCVIIIEKQSEMLSDLWEECYPHTTSDRIMMCADDVVFKTKGWDNTIVIKTPKAGEHLYFIWGNDLNQRRGLATLPMMSRLWIDSVGYFVPRGYRCDWCDTHIHDLANKLAGLGVDVRCYFKDVVFEHMHPSVGKAKWDDTYTYRRKMKSEASQFTNRNQERSDIANKLHDLVKSGKLKAGVNYG
jgi:glycosyltransferase involved in cell wall biosynthesis